MTVLEKLKQTNSIITPKLVELLGTPTIEVENLYDSMRYSVLSSGKRVRPHIVFEFSRLFGGNDEKALKFACAVEMLHASSLVHDDMPCIDNDDMRRGKPTTHKAYGEGVALFCGDALMYKAAEVASTNDKVGEKFALKATELLLKYGGGEGIIGGQIIDLESENKKIPFETLLKMHSLKTAALIKTSALLGCLAAEVDIDDERCKDAAKYAEAIGLTFQITDDILDADTEDGKTNFLSFMSIDEAMDYAKKETKKAIDAISKYENSEDLIELANFILYRKA